MIRTMLLIGLAITLIASNAASQSPSQPKRKLEGDERQALEPERGKLKKELLSPELLRRRAVPNELTTLPAFSSQHTHCFCFGRSFV